MVTWLSQALKSTSNFSTNSDLIACVLLGTYTYMVDNLFEHSRRFGIEILGERQLDRPGSYIPLTDSAQVRQNGFLAMQKVNSSPTMQFWCVSPSVACCRNEQTLNGNTIMRETKQSSKLNLECSGPTGSPNKMFGPKLRMWLSL